MNELIVWPQYIQEQRSHALVSHLASVALVHGTAHQMMDELGSLYRAAALDTDYTLRWAEALIDFHTRLTQLTPAQAAALEWRTQQFLAEMLAMTEEAGAALMAVLQQA